MHLLAAYCTMIERFDGLNPQTIQAVTDMATRITVTVLPPAKKSGRMQYRVTFCWTVPSALEERTAFAARTIGEIIDLIVTQTPGGVSFEFIKGTDWSLLEP